MLAEPDYRPAPARRVPVSVADRLRQAVLALTAGNGRIVRHVEKAWASVTFEGARHTLELAFEGAEAVAAGEVLIAALAEHEFTIPGQLVADAAVTAVDHALLPEPRLAVTCELLLLRDA